MTNEIDAQLEAEVLEFVASLPEPPSTTSLERRFQYLVDVERRLHDAGLAVGVVARALRGSRPRA
ncbi:MAG: hypothetical protein U5K30_13970 [Acidimicrobiales bacterium]|nr:hypothetical protein [Acidimicrobiales bacterium]